MNRKLPITDYLTVAEVAQRFDVREGSVRRWINRGLLKGVLCWCGRLRIHPDNVNAFALPTLGRPKGRTRRRVLELAGNGLDRKAIAIKVRVVPEYVRRILKEDRDGA